MRNPVVLVLDFFDQAALQQSRLYRQRLELTMETKALATPGMIQALIPLTLPFLHTVRL